MSILATMVTVVQFVGIRRRVRRLIVVGIAFAVCFYHRNERADEALGLSDLLGGELIADDADECVIEERSAGRGGEGCEVVAAVLEITSAIALKIQSTSRSVNALRGRNLRSLNARLFSTFFFARCRSVALEVVH